MEVQVVVGASGRWIAREIMGRRANGKPIIGGREWMGVCRHHWRRGEIEDAVRRAIRGTSAMSATQYDAPNGGASWEFEVEEDEGK